MGGPRELEVESSGILRLCLQWAHIVWTLARPHMRRPGHFSTTIAAATPEDDVAYGESIGGTRMISFL